MDIVRKIKRFLSMDRAKQFLLLEAFFYLGWARILKAMPFYKLAPKLGVYMDETPVNHDHINQFVVRKVSDAIHIMSVYTFWESQCLVKAIAAMKMLERRRLESTLYFGTAKDTDGRMIAHAWLRSGSFYVTGLEGMEKFTVVGKFAKQSVNETLMNNDCSLDLLHVSKELQLQLEMIKKSNSKEMETINRKWFEEIDWSQFLALSVHHRIYPFLYPKIKEVDEGTIPAYVIQELCRKFKNNTFKMLYLSREMGEISRLFSERKIRSLFLKGPVIAADFYENISLRTSGDIDVIVPIQDLKKVHELLLPLGYVKEADFETVLSEWKWRRHHVTYYHPEKKMKLEIHWRLHPGPCKEPTFHELWERKRISYIGTYPIYCLGKEDLFIFLLNHGSRHGWSRLRWLIDIDQLCKKDIEWDVVNKLLKKYHCRHIAGQALILSSKLFNTVIPEGISSCLLKRKPRRLAQSTIFYLERMVNLHTEPVPEEVCKYHERYLFSLKTNVQKLIFIVSFLYPYAEDTKTLPLPKILHFLYFPLRPMLWAWRKTRKRVLS